MRLIDFPPFTSVDPGNWPGLTLLAATALLEAEGEPEDGQLAVAYVCCNRARYHGWDLTRAILGNDLKAYDDGRPYEIFSCWNDDYRRQVQNRLHGMTTAMWELFYRLACAAYWKFEDDPTYGAYFYLNVELTKQIRGGSLPAWWDVDTESDSEVVLGRHTFRRRR